MCSCCSVATRKYWVFGCGTFTVLAALIAGLLWPTIYMKALYSELELRNGSMVFQNWVETPLPMYLEFTLFNWTNAAEVQARPHEVKPRFEEVGPYVFTEHHRREEIVWHPENGTVSFNQSRRWEFVPEQSTGSLDDLVTNVNVIATSAAYAARHFNTIMQMGLNIVLQGRANLTVTKPVRELLFDGYDDPLLDFIKQAQLPGISLPFDRFGWFYGRNNSVEYDGRLNMFTGAGEAAHSIERVGDVYSWNGANRTRFYRGQCGVVRGSTGELWHPNMRRGEGVEIFATDVCRTLPLSYAGETERLGVPGGLWVGDERAVDNGDRYPEMGCYCTAAPDKCPDLMAGVFNVSDCRFGAPAFVSYPHFYLADRSYGEAVEGMRPNRSLHQFQLALETMTGIPLEVNARLQINILMQPVGRIALFENMPKVMMPMFWFTQKAALNEEFADQAKMVISAPSIGIYAAYGVASLGAILLLIGVILTCTKSWGDQHELFHNAEDDDELRQ